MSTNPTTDPLTSLFAEIDRLDTAATPAPWVSFGKQAVVITEAKREDLTKEVLEQGKIIFGSPGWVDDDSDERIPDEQEVANCDLTALLRNRAVLLRRICEEQQKALEELNSWSCVTLPDVYSQPVADADYEERKKVIHDCLTRIRAMVEGENL